MLNLSAKNICLNGIAQTKEEAIHLVAQGLIENGNVAEGYEAGILAREAQTSTFLGNGIAIPHGTLDTRHLVQHTGVQIYQFPQGIDWGEGNTAYVVIGIAAKSDEHLTILRQLTTILGDENAAETLAKTNDLDQFIAILQGQHPLPAFTADLITTDIDSASLITLSAINAEKLQEKGYVNQTFISALLNNTISSLGNGIFINDCATGNLQNGIAIARNQQGKMLITVSAIDETLQPTLVKFIDPPFQAQLAQHSSANLLALLTGETVQAVETDAISANQTSDINEGELTATFIVKNEHGLHARPSAVLVSEVKKYNATVQVQNLDKNSPLVSAKSLMKIVALGATKGTRLRFVATGEQAQQALDGIGQAIASGLGE